jgi:transposase
MYFTMVTTQADWAWDAGAAATVAAAAAGMVHVAAAMSMTPQPTREEVLAIYRAGPEAVQALVDALLARITVLAQAHAALGAAHADLAQANAALVARVTHLEDRLALDSHNSSKPPSSDWGPREQPAPRSLRPPPGTSGRQTGGQPGHPGRTLRLVDPPDRLEVHRPTQCAACGIGLVGVAAGTVRLDAERRQVVDLPPLALEVTEHRVGHVACPVCGGETAGAFPVEVTQPVQYGERLQAMAVYLHDYQLLPYARTIEVLDDLFGAAPAEGTLQAAETTCFQGLAATEAAIKQALQEAAVAHFDETSVRVEGQREWLHVASTPTLTHYGVHPQRGRDATDAIGILPAFTGTAEHDAWAPYFTYDACAHALCNAHLLRELVYLHEQQHQAWADELATLLVTMKDVVDTARAAGQDRLDVVVRATLDAHYDHLLAQGGAANPPPDPPAAAPPKRGRPKHSKAQNLLARLTTHRRQVLAFVDDFAVPFDNNQAERDLRMMKVQQKISGGFRSAAGAAAFARIRGYVSTLRKQGLPILHALQGVFAGAPLLPNLTG